eukprot:777385-Prymnesium_polylepis.1
MLTLDNIVILFSSYRCPALVSGACRGRPVAYPDTGRRAAVSRGARLGARRPARRGERYTLSLDAVFMIVMAVTGSCGSHERAQERRGCAPN